MTLKTPLKNPLSAQLSVYRAVRFINPDFDFTPESFSELCSIVYSYFISIYPDSRCSKARHKRAFGNMKYKKKSNVYPAFFEEELLQIIRDFIDGKISFKKEYPKGEQQPNPLVVSEPRRGKRPRIKRYI